MTNSQRTLSFLSFVVLTLSSCFVSPAIGQSLDHPDLIQTFPTGDGPQYLAFDGANIWVSNFYGGSLTRLRASDGSPQGTFTAGPTPGQLAFDGANIWVSGWSDNSVRKLRASNGEILKTIPVGSSVRGLAWDGENIWVAIQDDDT